MKASMAAVCLAWDRVPGNGKYKTWSKSEMAKVSLGSPWDIRIEMPSISWINRSGSQERSGS